MLVAYGWCRVTLSEAEVSEKFGLPIGSAELDDRLDEAQGAIFDELEDYLKPREMPDLDWHFRRQMNNDHGMLLFASSRNHRGGKPTAVEVLEWIAERAQGACGVVYLHDDEDGDNSRVFRVWRLRRGQVDDLDDRYGLPVAD